MSDLRLRIHHFRQLGLCHNGARRWFDKHELSWQRLLDEGIPISELEHIDCAQAAAVIAHVKKEGEK